MPVERPEFRGLDEGRPVKKYQRNLPHWRQDGATYFVTFRLAGSIPRAVLEAWDLDRITWLRAHHVNPEWKDSDPGRFITTYEAIPRIEREQHEKHLARQLHFELDRGHGCCVLRHEEPSRMLADAMRFFDNERWWPGDFVVMPNHVHLLAQPRGASELEDILGSVKKFASRRIREWAKECGQEIELPPARIWQQESYDRIVRVPAELAAYRKYILLNPKKACLREGAFRYHRASWLDERAPEVDQK